MTLDHRKWLIKSCLAFAPASHVLNSKNSIHRQSFTDPVNPSEHRMDTSEDCVGIRKKNFPKLTLPKKCQFHMKEQGNGKMHGETQRNYDVLRLHHCIPISQKCITNDREEYRGWTFHGHGVTCVQHVCQTRMQIVCSTSVPCAFECRSQTTRKTILWRMAARGLACT